MKPPKLDRSSQGFDKKIWALIGPFGLVAVLGFISLGKRLNAQTNSSEGKG